MSSAACGFTFLTRVSEPPAQVYIIKPSQRQAHLDGNILPLVPAAVHGAEAALAHDRAQLQPRDGRLPIQLPLHHLRESSARV